MEKKTGTFLRHLCNYDVAKHFCNIVTIAQDKLARPTERQTLSKERAGSFGT